MTADKPMTDFDRAVARAADEFRKELEDARVASLPKRKPSLWHRIWKKSA